MGAGRADEPRRAGGAVGRRPVADRRPGRLVPRRDHLRAPRPRLRRLQRRRHRRLQRARPAPRLPRRPRRHGDLAAAVLPVAAARRRLRHRRLPHGPPRLRRPAPVQALPRRRPRPPHPRHHRARRQPHVRPAPVVPAGPPRAARLARARLLRVERPARPLRRRPRHLPGLRGVELDVGPGRRGLLLAPLLLPPARPQLRQPRRRGRRHGHARLLARHGRRRPAPRRRAVPPRARGHELREPARDPRGPQAAAQAHGRPLPGPHAAGRGEPVARGRRRRTSATATSAT